MGLPKAVENLVILLYAEQTNRTFYLHGAPSRASLTTCRTSWSCGRGSDRRRPSGKPQCSGRRAFSAQSRPLLLNAANVTALAGR